MREISARFNLSHYHKSVLRYKLTIIVRWIVRYFVNRAPAKTNPISLKNPKPHMFNVSKKHKERMPRRLTGRCGGERADSVDEHWERRARTHIARVQLPTATDGCESWRESPDWSVSLRSDWCVSIRIWRRIRCASKKQDTKLFP